MITLKLRELVASTESIENILKTKLPITVAWQLKRIGKKIGEELQEYDSVSSRLLQELGTPDKNTPNQFLLQGENLVKYNTELETLLSKQLNLDFEPIKLADFGTDVKVSAADLMSCESFIVD